MKKTSFFFLMILFFSFAGFSLSIRVTAGGRLREAELTVSAPEGESVKRGIRVFCGNVWYRLYFSEQEIQALKGAADKYSSDFNTKKLKKKDRGQREKYGNISLFLEWGSSREKTDRRASAKASAGYTFKNSSPYFALVIPSVKNQDTDAESRILQSSGDLPLLFNRAQLKDLIDKLTAL